MTKCPEKSTFTHTTGTHGTRKSRDGGRKNGIPLKTVRPDLRKLSALKLRMAEAARKCDRAMRTDIAFDDLCASVEKTTDDLDVVLAL